jgi:hypothetical protein
MQVAIRCHPCAPVATDEVEHWLWSELDRLRAQAPEATLRMLRLTQSAPTSQLEVGWLVEVDAPDGDALVARDGLEDVLRDMRLLGLQPTVLRSNGSATSAVAPDPVDRMCDDSFPASDPPSAWTWDVGTRQRSES